MRRTAILILLLSTLGHFKLTSASQSKAIFVDTPADVVADDGKCSLREAIALAEMSKSTARPPGECSGSPSVIMFSGTLQDKVLVTRPLAINGSVTIRGLGRHRLALSGDTTTRIFFVEKNANLIISDIELRDAADSAIYINGGIANLDNCGFSYNASFSGGAIYNNHGTVALNQSVLSHNRAGYGGAIFNDGGTVTLNGTTVEQSFVSVGGGAIHSQSGALSITASMFEFNKGSQYGGGIYLRDGTAAISASLFATMKPVREAGSIRKARRYLS